MASDRSADVREPIASLVSSSSSFTRINCKADGWPFLAFVDSAWLQHGVDHCHALSTCELDNPQVTHLRHRTNERLNDDRGSSSKACCVISQSILASIGQAAERDGMSLITASNGYPRMISI